MVKVSTTVAAVAIGSAAAGFGLAVVLDFSTSKRRPAAPPAKTIVVNNTVIPENTPLEVQRIVSGVGPSVVRIKTPDGHGSGFPVGLTLVLSAKHCETQEGDLVVTGDTHPHRVAGVFPAEKGDVALIRTETPVGVPPLPVAKTNQAVQTAVVAVIIGYPGGHIYSMPHKGVLPRNRGKDRYGVEIQEANSSLVDHTIAFFKGLRLYLAPVQGSMGGMSGGPVVKVEDGVVIGLHARGLSTEEIQNRGFQATVGVQPVTENTIICLPSGEKVPLGTLIKQEKQDMQAMRAGRLH